MKTIALLTKARELTNERKKQMLAGIQNIILNFDKVIIEYRIVPPLLEIMLEIPPLAQDILPSLFKVIKSKDIITDLYFKNKIWPNFEKLMTGNEISAQALYIILENCVELIIPRVE